MLLLARKVGETIHIGDDVLLSVKNIGRSRVTIELQIPLDEIISIGSDTNFRVTQIEEEQAKMGVVAPRRIRIMRGELLSRGQRNRGLPRAREPDNRRSSRAY